MRRAAWIAIGLAAVAGCKSVPPTHVLLTPAARLPADWTVGTSRDGKVSIGIPPGWRYGVDKASDDLQGLMGSSDNEAVRKMAADLQNQSSEQEQNALADLERKGIIINAINGTKKLPGEERTHFYVRRTRGDGNATWADAISAEKGHYAFAPEPKEVKLPIGRAYRFQADDSLRDGATLHQISYVVVDGQEIFSLRFVTEESAETISSIAYGVANTWRIEPSHK